MKVLFSVIDTEADEVKNSYIVETSSMRTAKEIFSRNALPFFPMFEGCFEEMLKVLSGYGIKIIAVDLDSAKNIL